MPSKPKISVRLVTCGRFGKPKGNPFTHVCVTRLDKPRKARRSTIAPKVSATVACGTCGQRYSNPLTHVCVTSDFKQRAAADKRRRATDKRRQAAAAKREK